MGNYMETCIQRKPAEEETSQHDEKQGPGKTSGTVRVKLVLTKDELQWLLLQMKKDEGRKLEQVLQEIEKSRLAGESVTKWKPCLESIMESPEAHHNMDRSSKS
ncbi:hypothetical protein SSX86_029660 [Deinandra increscens subsp. villosa]|uniref:Uncharacterized protein n=1 Tax=Deinandra increscens subsp. villosa TaxID=3103831 RepID=A0AAP0CFG3_9ASTR